MIVIFSIILVNIFMLLGILHFSWALGNTWGLKKALPTNKAGVKILNPRKLDCAIVGVGLFAVAFFYLCKAGIFNIYLPNWIVTYGSWIIPFIFILRAMGDFKYVGFFKKVKQTDFGKFDSRYFSPLCLLIGLTGILIEII